MLIMGFSSPMGQGKRTGRLSLVDADTKTLMRCQATRANRAGDSDVAVGLLQQEIF